MTGNRRYWTSLLLIVWAVTVALGYLWQFRSLTGPLLSKVGL
jgi:hypothetical protein